MTTMIDAERLQQLRDSANEAAGAQVALALTAIGEARGDDADGSSLEERVAVMCVIRNRVRAGRFGSNWGAVIFQPKQFSCWNDEDSNRALLLSLSDGMKQQPLQHLPQWLFALYAETYGLAQLVYQNTILDHTGGATHYYAPAAMKPAGSMPSWALGKMFKQIGSQRFYVL